MDLVGWRISERYWSRLLYAGETLVSEARDFSERLAPNSSGERAQCNLSNQWEPCHLMPLPPKAMLAVSELTERLMG